MDKPFPAYKGDDPYLFVCYAHEDAEKIYPELKELHESGVNIWYDEGISAGRVWRAEIAHAIRGAAQFVYYISNASLASDHCNREVHFALDKGAKILPVYLEDVELTDELDLALSRVQALSRDADSNYRVHLLESLAVSTQIAPQTEPIRSIPTKRNYFLAVILVALFVGFGWWLWLPSMDSPSDLSAEKQTPSIAVLPFKNMSSDQEQEFFSDGIAEDILNSLARNPSFIVRPRSSSLALKNSNLALPELAQLLEVTHILEGSVQRSGDRIRVTVQLSSVQANQSIWSDRFERDMTDVFMVQDEITREVSRALTARLVEDKVPRVFASTEAYEAFLRARAHFNESEWDAAEHWFEIATTLDPLNAEAWADRARNLSIQVWAYRVPPERYEKEIHAYLARARDIDPQLPTTYAYGVTQKFFDGQHQQAVEEAVSQVTRNPNSTPMSLIFILGGLQRFDLADHVAEHWAEIAPLSESFSIRIELLLASGKIEEALALVDKYGRRAISNRHVRVLLLIVTKDLPALNEMLSDQGSFDEVDFRIYKALYHYLSRQPEKAYSELALLNESSAYQSLMTKHTIALIEGDLDAGLSYYREAIKAKEPEAMIPYRRGYINLMWRRTFPEFYPTAEYESLLSEFALDQKSLAKIEVPPLPF